MPTTERERKFITTPNQARRLADSKLPTYITQHYFSPPLSSDELRTRRSSSAFEDPTHEATLKHGFGEYRTESEVELSQPSHKLLIGFAQAGLQKLRYALGPGLTLDTFAEDSQREHGVVEIEQQPDASDIGLFDTMSLGVGHLTEVTGQPNFSSRALAAERDIAQPEITPLSTVFSVLDEKLHSAEKPIVVTLSGASASGKTTILNQFTERYGRASTLISTDDYYIGKSRMRLTMPEGHTTNFDHPDAIDTQRLARDLTQLTRGQFIARPHYDMAKSEPSEHIVPIEPTPLIIVEGIAANLPVLREHSSLSLALTAPIHERLRRRIARDVTRKGHTADETLSLFMNHVEPSYQAYFEPHDTTAEYTLTSEF